jgi:ferredoxin
MKIVADYARCDAHGNCMAACPEVFLLDDNDELHLLEEEPPEELREKVESAVRLCPKAALTLID